MKDRGDGCFIPSPDFLRFRGVLWVRIGWIEVVTI